MATLVFSTVGTLLGGPVGGAIGSLIGQSIDQQVLGGGPRKGPRLGDLSVQTSSYGSPIPRIYGRMRVAGTIVWATDLEESSVYAGGKGQPESVAYNYSVSLALVLSSRPVQRVRRIWADGKLIRGAAGDFKAKTTFRFYSGGEDHVVDPLIASMETPELTPAYRGRALAVFENLELAEFGNRIPFFTFELEADEIPPAVRDVVSDVSDGVVACEDRRALAGYAAYGADRRAALEPVIDAFGVETETSEASAAKQVSQSEMGCCVAGKAEPQLERRHESAASAPTIVTIGYYDAARDYQAGLARAALGACQGKAVHIDAPCVLDPEVAKALAHDRLIRDSGSRERLLVRLSPAWMTLRPGDSLLLPGDPNPWQVERCSIEAMIVIAELSPCLDKNGNLASDGGRAALSPDDVIAPTKLALFDLPVGVGSSAAPQVLVAACSASRGWKPVCLEVAIGDTRSFVASAPVQSVLGRALSALSPGQAFLFDRSESVEIELVDASDWLTSCDDDALVLGANLAAIGDELMQFGTVEAIGAGRFRLSRLVRGRRGTEWAMAGHQVDEPFALVSPTSLRGIDLPASARGSMVGIRPLGVADEDAAATIRLVSGERLRPPSPVHLKIARSADDALQLQWTARSREGWDWLDGADSPFGEMRELYRVLLAGPQGSVETEVVEPFLAIPADQVALLGQGPVFVEVTQVGDLSASHPARAEIQLSL